MSFPTQAIDPNGKMRSILVDSQGRLVTNAAPKPAVTYPITQRSLRLDAEGKVKLSDGS